MSVISKSFAEWKHTGRQKFTVALSGAGMIPVMSDVIRGLNHLTPSDWQSFAFFFVDERLVPFESTDSSFGEYKRQLLTKTKDYLTEKQFVPINPLLSPDECATDYESKVRKTVGTAGFDLILLGFGPDGHTGSLFPGHKLLHETGKWIAAITDSPKPPPVRVTFTLSLINGAADIVVLGTGASKQEIVCKVFKEGDKTLPVNMVSTSSGRKVKWIIDSDAAKLIQ